MHPSVTGPRSNMMRSQTTPPPLDASGILRFQSIVGALLYYSRAVDNKLLVALSELGQQQSTATEATNDSINQILDYVATYPADGITFLASDMVLSAHPDVQIGCVGVG